MPSCMKSLKPEQASQIACGKSHTIISTVSGKVFSCGSNGEGQLGVPEVTERTTPTQVTGIKVKPGGIKQVSAGCLHSACLTDDGKVYVWGTNSDGQLGLGNAITTAEVPTAVNLPKPAVYISCGYYHTAFITDDGKLYICGEGENGKLGLAETGNVFTPKKVAIDSPVDLVACGGKHTIAVTKNNDVYGFGSNFSGQLGLGSKVDIFSVPQLISALTGKQIRSVACGESHTAFVSARGHLFMCGDGRYGKLCKDVNNDEDVSEYTPQRVERFDNYDVSLVACGGCHTMVQAATKTLDRGKDSPKRNDGVTLVLERDRMENNSPNRDLRAGDSVNPSPKSARLPPLHLTPGRDNGSILDSPSVEIAPGNEQVEQINGTTTTKNVIAVFESTKDSDDGSSGTEETGQMNGGDTWRPNGESLDEVLHKLNVRDASDLQNGIATVENGVKAATTKVETGAKAAMTTVETGVKAPMTEVETGAKAATTTVETGSKAAMIEVETGTKAAMSRVENRAKAAMIEVETGTKAAMSRVENRAKAATTKVENGTKAAMSRVENRAKAATTKVENGAKAANTKAETAKEEIAKAHETLDITDKMAESGDTVILNEVIRINEAEPGQEKKMEEEEADEKEKQDEERSEDDEDDSPEVEIDLHENGENKEDGENENEVIAEQKNDTEPPKDEKKNTTAEKAESRMSKFLNTFRRKKLSEENVSLSPAWTTVDRKISSDNTLVNNRTMDKPSVTRIKSGQPQRSKACVII